jgi:nuclear GTP-binding protein
LRHKYKVIKKVKEHHRKILKKSKKDAKAGIKPHKRRDPGVPAAWPLKAELATELLAHRARAAQSEADRRVKRAKVKAEEEENGGEGGAPPTPDAAAPVLADPSRRAFGSELAKVVSAADVVIQVLDARDPASCRCPALEKAVRLGGSGTGRPKTLVFLLNKVDLVPRSAAEAWLTALRVDGPALAFKASTQRQAAHLSQRKAGAGGSKKRGRGAVEGEGGALNGPSIEEADGRPVVGAACVGADALLRLLRSIAASYNGGSGGAGGGALPRPSITVAVAGLPNVGKSSIINSLARARVARVGNAPGITRTAQSIRLDKGITLLDSPGVVLSRATAGDGHVDLALRGAARVDGLGDPQAAAAAVLRRAPPASLVSHYRLPGSPATPTDLLAALAMARGKLRPGGAPDLDAAARVLVHDWAAGRVPYFTLPPKTIHPTSAAAVAAEGAAVLAAPAPAFNIDVADASAALDDLPRLDPGAAAALAAKASRFFVATPAGVPSEIESPDEADAEAEALYGSGGPVRKADVAADSSDEEEEEEDAEEGGEEEDARPASARARNAPSQAPALYSAPGQFNPHAARAARKAAAKAGKAARGVAAVAADALAEGLAGVGGKRGAKSGGGGGGNDDYSFKEAFGGGVSSGEDEEMA